MATEVRSLQPPRQPPVGSPLTAEHRYWKAFKSQLLTPFSAAITHISSPGTPNCEYFAITSGNRVQIYSSRTRSLVRNVARTQSTARSGEIRGDGRILATGGDDGLIKIFDTQTRSQLKSCAHSSQSQLPVWAVRFCPSENTTFMSCGDDHTVKVWDLASSNPVTSFNSHTDYVRSGCFLSHSSHLLASASYDCTVRIWDSRVPHRPVMTFQHQQPVETILPTDSGTMMIAAAGSQVSILDFVAGKPQHSFTNHQKTVMSLCFASNGARLLSGGLDGHLKVMDTKTWNVVAAIKYPAPIHSLAVIRSGEDGHDRHLVVATAARESAYLSIRTRLLGRSKGPQANSLKSNLHGKAPQKRKHEELHSAQGLILDSARWHKRSTKEIIWNKHLRHGRYAQALDVAMEQAATKNFSVLQLLVDLRHRSALREALENRDEEDAVRILKWVVANLVNTYARTTCLDVALHLIDLYAGYVAGSPALEAGFQSLYHKVKKEISYAYMALETIGMVNTVAVDAMAAENGGATRL